MTTKMIDIRWRTALAFVLSFLVHIRQRRKYTGSLYWWHLYAVAKRVRMNGGDDRQVAAAYMHDSVEDQNFPRWLIRFLFGKVTYSYVDMLTEVPDPTKNRKTRKAEVCAKWSRCTDPKVKLIKLADVDHNTLDIYCRDKKFAPIYLEEIAALLPHLYDESHHDYHVALTLTLEAMRDNFKKA